MPTSHGRHQNAMLAVVTQYSIRMAYAGTALSVAIAGLKERLELLTDIEHLILEFHRRMRL
jgi:hypothetical protein